MTVTCQVT